MAKKKKGPSTVGGIPAWFMTYSDVITLLMTFFILLMTFATQSKERTEKTKVTMFHNSGGSGIAGDKANAPPKDTWVNRIRNRSARIAMRGAEMPPATEAPATEAIGEGHRALTEDEDKQDDMSSHNFEIPLIDLIDSLGTVTAKGEHLAGMLSVQLRNLNVHASLQVSEPVLGPQLVLFADFLIHREMVRPGLVGIGVSDCNTSAGKVRIVIERYEEGSR